MFSDYRGYSGPLGLELIEIDIPLGRRLVGILFGDLQHLVELLAQNVVVSLVLLHGFLERVVAAIGFAFEAVNGRFHIGNRGRLDMLLVADHSRGSGIDMQLGLAARAGYRNQWDWLSHTGILV